MSELLILIEGRLAARIVADRSGRLSLTYDPAWLAAGHSFPLSVSMPLGTLTYPHKLISPHLWNLLPENPNVLQRWAHQYHVSAANPFKLLTYVGADVPGAAQFIPPEQADAIESEHAPRIDWISIADLRERLRQLREDISAVRRPGDIGKLSLPGAQAKTAFYWDVARNRWGIPGGRTPTTHIIKPCIPGFDGLLSPPLTPAARTAGGRRTCRQTRSTPGHLTRTRYSRPSAWCANGAGRPRIPAARRR